MNCPFCRSAETRVVDSRSTDDATAIRRRRLCPSCGQRFTTIETMSMLVVKRSGVVEPFSRDKVVSGVRKACQGRPVSEDDLALLAHDAARDGIGADALAARLVDAYGTPPDGDAAGAVARVVGELRAIGAVEPATDPDLPTKE